MNKPLDDLLKMMKDVPTPPFHNQTVLIPATRNERGELVPANDAMQVLVNRCVESEVRFQLSEHVPLTDEDGQAVVWAIENVNFAEI